MIIRYNEEYQGPLSGIKIKVDLEEIEKIMSSCEREISFSKSSDDNMIPTANVQKLIDLIGPLRCCYGGSHGTLMIDYIDTFNKMSNLALDCADIWADRTEKLIKSQNYLLAKKSHNELTYVLNEFRKSNFNESLKDDETYKRYTNVLAKSQMLLQVLTKGKNELISQNQNSSQKLAYYTATKNKPEGNITNVISYFNKNLLAKIGILIILACFFYYPDAESPRMYSFLRFCVFVYCLAFGLKLFLERIHEQLVPVAYLIIGAYVQPFYKFFDPFIYNFSKNGSFTIRYNVNFQDSMIYCGIALIILLYFSYYYEVKRKN